MKLIDIIKKRRPEMNSFIKTAKMDTKILLILLWVFYSLNFIYGDVLSSLEPGVLQNEIAGYVADGSIKITEGFLLGTAIMFEIPFLMIVLSWVLKYRVNRWANIIAGTLFIAAQIGSLFMGKPSPAYIFYSTIEVAGLLLIVWKAWKWRNPEGQPS
jgi:ABC-type nickel/cobalt efflux system permease component RcnA